MDKGAVSNCISAGLLGLSFVLPEGTLRSLGFTTGMFALSGGLTNWLAVKMLFDRIPGLIGSGVVPARFREIRSAVKELILEHFFSPEYLEEFFAEHAAAIDWRSYVKANAGAYGPVGAAVKGHWKRLTGRETIQPVVDEQIEKLADSSIGGFLLMVGLDTVRPAVHNFVGAFVGAMEERVAAAASTIGLGDLDFQLDRERLVKDVRAHLERLLAKKLERLEAAEVKKMVENMIRRHLGWLVVWGNVFGAALGIVAYYLEPLLSS